MEEIEIKTDSLCPKGYELNNNKSSVDTLVYTKLVPPIKSLMLELNSTTFKDKYIKKTLKALRKLMIVAKHLNKHEILNYSTDKYFIYYDSFKKDLVISKHISVKYGIVYFKTKGLAIQAVVILGKDTIMDSLKLC